MSGEIHCAAHLEGGTFSGRVDELLFDTRRYGTVESVQYRVGDTPAEPVVILSELESSLGMLTISDTLFQRALAAGRLRIRLISPDANVSDFDLDMAALRTLIPTIENCK